MQTRGVAVMLRKKNSMLLSLISDFANNVKKPFLEKRFYIFTYYLNIIRCTKYIY